MNNINNGFDQNKMKNIKNLVDSGNINEAISQISPEMIENFSKIMNNNQSSNNTNNFNNSKNSNNSNGMNNSNTYKNTYNPNNNNPNNNNSNSSNNSENNGFDFNNIDMNTILKMKSIMDNMNNKNDPRSNLLNSLKPYLRDTKKEKLDQYVNLLYFSKVAEMLNNNNKKDD